MGCTYTGNVFGGSVCKDGMGGIKSLWIQQYGEEIIAVDAATNLATVAGDWYLFQLPMDIGDALEDITADPKLGTAFVIQTVSGTVLGLSAENSKALSEMAKTRQVIIAELYNGEYVLYGALNGLDMTSGGSRTGGEAASLQGYEVTWTGKEKKYAPFVTNVDFTKVTVNA